MTIYKWEENGWHTKATVRPPELFDLSTLQLFASYKGMNHFHALNLKAQEEQLFMIEQVGYMPRVARGIVESLDDIYLKQDQAELAALATI